MELVIIVGLLVLAIIIFLVFDLFKARIKTGFYPFTKRTLATYGPYTLIRVIIVAAIYWLGVFIPSIFNIPLLPEWEPHWPLIMAITAPFLYLALFSLLGGLIIKHAPGGGGELGRYITQVYEEIRIWGKASLINKLDTVALGDIQACFCGQLGQYVAHNKCMLTLEETATNFKALPSATPTGIKRGKIRAFIDWMTEQTKQDNPSYWMNVLRTCIDETAIHSGSG